MPLSFEIDEGARLVRLTTDERPSVEEWLATIDLAFADARFRPGYDFLYDRTLVRRRRVCR